MHTTRRRTTLTPLTSLLSAAFRVHTLFAMTLALLLTYLATFSAQAATEAVIPPAVKLNLPALFYGDEFGHSVAIDGDYIVASAWRTNVGEITQQGVVYIFERDNSDPLLFNHIKTLTANDAQEYHGFGSAVAIHGDTIVIGAIYDGDSGFQAGAAYIFERDHGGANAWGQVKKLVDANFSDQFSEHGTLGEAVAIHGDTVVVGAPQDRGRVIVFERDRGGINQWGEAQILNPPNYWERGGFGEAISFDGTRIVVGGDRSSIVPGHHNNEGAVFIFEHNDTEWVQVGKLVIGDEDPETPYANNSRFGQAVALYGDTIYVGAPSLAIGDLSLVGTVFVFEHIVGGQWPMVGIITPSDNAFDDSFGASLYAVNDGVFVASNKGVNGTVHFYQRSSVAAESAGAANTHDLWSEAFSFSTTEEVTGSRFGQPITGSGNSFVAGASGYDAGLGTVYTYPLDELLAAAPPVPSGEGGAFLPMVVYDPAQIPIETIAGQLGNNGILTGPNDFRIGAVANTLTETIDLTIATVSPPSEPLPNGVTAKSNYFLLSSEENLLVDSESPFVISIPVPAGADGAHLALAYLQPEGEMLDGDPSEAMWTFLPGAYDADHNLFLTTLPFLKEDGANLLLVEHPDIDSPLNTPTAHTAIDTRPFSAFCWHGSFPSATSCTEAMETQVKSALDEIYLGMVNQYGFPAKLRLLNSGSSFIVSEVYSVTAATATYAIYIIHKSNILCKGAVGTYNPETGMLIVCLSSNQSVNSEVRDTLLHELFHAIQFTYPRVLQDRQLKRQQDWIIEGMATSAEKSYALGTFARTAYFGFENLRKVNMPLTEGTVTDKALDEYYAQDFWVYFGQSEGRDLSVLDPLLAIGGATAEGIELALISISNGEVKFKELYWGWVKNQSIEHTFDLGGGPGQLCMLAEESLIDGKHISFPSSDLYYPSDFTWDYLPPLTAKVIEIKIPHTDDSLLVTTLFRECSAYSEPDEERACHKTMESLMHAKVYAEGEANCQLEALPGVFSEYEGERILGPIVQGKRYFVVIANADLKEQHGFAIQLE